MTLNEARENIGAHVLYTAHHGAQESGVITSVSTRLVFVQYRPGAGSIGTYPQDLELTR